MADQGHNFINGKRVVGTSGVSHDLINPATGEVIDTVQLAGVEDVNDAVAAAKAAFAVWSKTPPAERSAALNKLADVMQERADEYAAVETKQTGKTMRMSTQFDVPGSIDNVSFYAGAARNIEGRGSTEYDGEHTSIIRREPVGVVGSIAPWNYPLQMAMWKILPAIAAGNTIVLKPAEITPLTSVMFAEDCIKAGIPAGVVNIVTGAGRVAGEALITHPDVRMVSFTGSTAVGKRVGELAVQGVKKVHLELGGKAPFVVFDDADLEAAVQGATAGSLINAGQDCTAATRVYVQRPLYDTFVSRLQEVFESVQIGDPTDLKTDMGSLSSKRHQEKVAAMVERAKEDGAKVLVGGEMPTGELAKGSYYPPTLIVDATQDSEIVQEEVFGPVLVVLPFETDDEGIELANDTPYGLAASAWTSNVFRSLRASSEIQAGAVWINDHIPIVSEMPHGGYKASGFGKDMSQYSLDDYLQIKHVSMDTVGEQRKEWHRTIFG